MTDLLEQALLRGSLDHCVKCTICETQCPVANVSPLFPGPKYAGPQSERYRVASDPSVDLSVDYCSGCGICSQVCPQGVKIAEINAQARDKLKRQKGWPLRDRIITRPTWLGRAGTPVAPLANLSLKLKPARIVIEKTLGIHREAAMPSFAGRRFSSWARKRSDGAEDGTEDRLLPRLRHRVLRAVGGREAGRRSSSTTASRWSSPNRTAAVCRCSPAACSTMPARCCARLRPRSTRIWSDEDTIIVGNATSCTLMLKREGREVLSLEDDPVLKRVSGRVYDICELLLELHDRGELATDFTPVDEVVAYHAPASSRATGSASRRSTCWR